MSRDASRRHRMSSTLLVALLTVSAAAVALFLGGVGIYVLASYGLMGPHAAERHPFLSLRAMARETFLAVVSQPFLPLFYVVGRRMDRLLLPGARRGLATLERSDLAEPTPRADAGAATGERVLEVMPASPGHHVPIVLVHGYMQNRVGFVALARALAARGLGPIFGFNYPWFSSIDKNAERLARFVDGVCAETEVSAVDLVCHSMGGLVAMEMMRRRARDPSAPLRVRRCVTIATPHAGVVWRGPILGIGATNLRRGSALLEAQAGTAVGVPCLSVYSTHDNIVHPKETAQLAKRGGRDVEVDGEGHLAILFSKAVADHVATFLSEGEPS